MRFLLAMILLIIVLGSANGQAGKDTKPAN
jgi:hypothetical protein